jgi:hypothetical protein
MMAPATLADQLDRPAGAVKKALGRWRKAHREESGRGWVEVQDGGPRDPQYLYRAGTVRQIVLAVKSRECPAKKNPP